MNYTLSIVIIVFLSCAISYFAMPSIINISRIKSIFDEPNERKKHATKTPNLGGIGIFAGIVLAFSIFNEHHDQHEVRYLVPAMIIIFFAGIVDDIVNLTPLKKLLAQLLSAILVVYLGEIQITSFYGLFGIQEIPYIISVIFSIMAIIAVINCFKLVNP